MKKPKKAIDIIEKARTYSILAKNNLEKPIHIGSRKKLASLLLYIDPSMVIATYGSKQKCIILLDYEFGQLIDIIEGRKYVS